MPFYNILITGILLMCFSNGSVAEPFVNCIMGNPKKCMGLDHDMVNPYIPDLDARLISSDNQPNRLACFELCTENALCFMAVFRNDIGNCSMYENIRYLNTIDSNSELYVWRCCNPNKSYQVPKRCPGFWRYKQNYISRNKDRNESIIPPDNSFYYTCQMKCLANPICGTINVLMTSGSHICELITQFPVNGLILEPRWNWNTYIWQCAANYTLPEPKKSCKPRLGMNFGYFSIENRSIPMPRNLKSLLYFPTYNYEVCLENCMKYEHCKRAWYSLTSLFCYLESDGQATCAEHHFFNYSFTTYRWNVCHQNFSISDTELQSSQCHKIINNQHMYSHETPCAHLPSDMNKTYSCVAPDPPILYNSNPPFHMKFHCQNKQSFKIVNKLENPKGFPGRFSNMTWVRVFTGYESFWLANVTETSFPMCPKSECDIYNSDMNSHGSDDLKIISKNMWFAQRSRGPKHYFPPNPVPIVMITDTERPFCNCFTTEACSYKMRWIQEIFFAKKDFDILYNFIITGDGVVYEARGWEYESEACGPQYNHLSISIALCGRYFKEPSVIMLNSVKKLIQMGIERKKVAKDYSIFLLKDICLVKGLPLSGLSSVIQLWPRYRGHFKFKCQQWGFLIIFLNLFSTLFVFGLTIVFMHMFIVRIYHDKLCKTVMKYRIEKIYGNFETDKNFHKHLHVGKIGDLRKKDHLVSPFTTTLLWIEDKLDNKGNLTKSELKCKCKAGIFSMFNLQRFQSKLVDISSVVLLPEIQACSRFIGVVFEKPYDIDNQTLIILHCSNLESLRQSVFRLYSDQCLCLSYSLSTYYPDTKTLSFYHNIEEPSEPETAIKKVGREDVVNRYNICWDKDNHYCVYE